MATKRRFDALMIREIRLIERKTVRKPGVTPRYFLLFSGKKPVAYMFQFHGKELKNVQSGFDCSPRPFLFMTDFHAAFSYLRIGPFLVPVPSYKLFPLRIIVVQIASHSEWVFRLSGLAVDETILLLNFSIWPIRKIVSPSSSSSTNIPPRRTILRLKPRL